MLRNFTIALLAGCQSPDPGWGPSGGDSVAPAQRDVLMISLDTAQLRRLDAATAPNVHGLFDRSLVLGDHYSCSNWTYASMLCVMGGAYDLDQGYVPDPELLPPAPDALVMASEVMAASGWRVGLVSSNPFLGGANNTFPDAHVAIPLPDGTPADVVTATAEPLLRELAARPEPFYLHVHYTDPHAPYTPPAAYREALDALDPIAYDLDEDERALGAIAEDWPALSGDEQALILEHLDARYRGELRAFDDQLGILLETAEALGLYEDGAVVFWTDHGEQLFEHGGVAHRLGLYEELTRAVASFAGAPWAPGDFVGPTTHADIWPTLFDALGVDPGATFTGQPLGARPDDDPRYALKYLLDQESAQFVVRGDDKLIYTWAGEKMRFDLAADPLEQVNLYGQDPALEADLWTLLLPKVRRAQELTEVGFPVDPGP